MLSTQLTLSKCLLNWIGLICIIIMCVPVLKDKVYVDTILYVYHLVTNQYWLLLKAYDEDDNDEIF